MVGINSPGRKSDEVIGWGGGGVERWLRASGLAKKYSSLVLHVVLVGAKNIRNSIIVRGQWK